MNAILNERLTLELLPAAEADWLEILAFAQTFDGYEFWGSFERCAAFAEAKGHASLTGLRTCLFFEHRKWQNGDEEKPNNKTERYWRSLVAKIRTLVEATRREPRSR